MAHKNLTSSGAITVGSSVSKLLIQVNAALTGNIVVADVNGTFATITNPTVGSQYEYWDTVGATTVNPSTTCDITISADSSRLK
jgi:hypothetical protein